MKSISRYLAPSGVFALASFGMVFLSSCGGEKEKEKPAVEETSESASSSVIEEVFLSEKPTDASPVLALRKVGKPGDKVVVFGKIGGAMKPFTEGFATFILADRTLKTCDLNPEDLCETPWDACCADPDVIKASRLTVQIVDGDRFPIEKGLRTVNGLSELDELVVVGEVAEGSNADNMIVNATGIFLEKQWVAAKGAAAKEG